MINRDPGGFFRARSARATCFALFLCAAAARGTDTTTVFTADLSQGQVEIALRAEPAQVRMDRDLIVTLQVSAPAYLKVALPDLRERFRGFTTADGFVRDPVTDRGTTRCEQRWRLVPDLMRTYRLSPFAVEVTDTRLHPGTTSWFATRPVVFPPEPAPPTVSGSPEVSPRPFWIAPTPRTVLGWVGLAILLAVSIAAIIRGASLLRRHVRELRLSPRERAFAELERLLRRDLLAKRLYKDFYIELTMVVRRYIERAHALHAPEQTTEEFLAAAARHPHFSPEVLARLKAFLESADLVKFAGQEATPRTADDAVHTAREYIVEDAGPETGAGKGLRVQGSGSGSAEPERRQNP